jgi:hypothetical protein
VQDQGSQRHGAVEVVGDSSDGLQGLGCSSGVRREAMAASASARV